MTSGKLKVGDHLLQRDGTTVTITAIRRYPADVTVYNFTVAGDHDYYVSEAQLLVHNCPARSTGGAPLTNSQITDMAKRLGYRATKYRTKGQIVFTNGKTFITQDTDSYSGGLWKMARTVAGLSSKSTRLGTYDYDLNYIGP